LVAAAVVARPVRRKQDRLEDRAAAAAQPLALERRDKVITAALAVRGGLHMLLAVAAALEQLVETPLRLRVAQVVLGLPTL
jgi:hypothetical protein